MKGLPILLAFGLVLCLACNETSEVETVDLEQAKMEILKLHHDQQKYHLEKDSINFARSLSDNFISVNRGRITTPSYEDNLKRYNNYFSSVEFIKWEDTSPPVVRFSEDGKLAYTIVEKEVIVQHAGEDGKKMETQTNFAWLSIYKKYDTGWKIDAVSSTNKPSVVKEISE